ncbi:hypothetical protein C7476_12158 [Phyllobacterium bourgognense]|uniref:Uncharacterized protein n=1 Tax=Phyllobacterium bourgognense TaxID=314236 RepID=A0A368YF77_9HYPH|nr:hypothetical protein C7476_12158 [Phyllobacterium bourgognense]
MVNEGLGVDGPKEVGAYVSRHLECIRAVSSRYEQLLLVDKHFASEKVLAEALDAGWTLFDIQIAMKALGHDGYR